MVNRLPNISDKHKICIICEGNEEYKYIERLNQLHVWNDIYDISLVNAEGNGNIPARYQDRYQNGAYEVVLVFCDTETTPYTSPCGFAQCYVFVKQSHGPFRCASGHCPGGPLLPKLRGHVAEFLNEVSPARLGILAPSHLCRFWYGRHVSIGRLFWEAWTRGLERDEPSLGPAVPCRTGVNRWPRPLSFSERPLEPSMPVQEC